MAKSVEQRMREKLVMKNLFDEIGGGQDETADNTASCLHGIKDDRTCDQCTANSCDGGGDCDCGKAETVRLAVLDRGGP